MTTMSNKSIEYDFLIAWSKANTNNNFKQAIERHVINGYNLKILTYFEAYLKNQLGDDYWINVKPTTENRMFTVDVRLSTNGYDYRDSDIVSIINIFKISITQTYDNCRFRLRYCNWNQNPKTVVVDVTFKHLSLTPHWVLQFIQVENNRLIILGCQKD